eukprot:9487812-Pyramimonas_sp.AAC.1
MQHRQRGPRTQRTGIGPAAASASPPTQRWCHPVRHEIQARSRVGEDEEEEEDEEDEDEDDEEEEAGQQQVVGGRKMMRSRRWMGRAGY